MIRAMFVAWLAFNVGVYLGIKMHANRDRAIGSIYGIMVAFPNLICFCILVMSVFTTLLGGGNLWRW